MCAQEVLPETQELMCFMCGLTQPCLGSICSSQCVFNFPQTFK